MGSTTYFNNANGTSGNTTYHYNVNGMAAGSATTEGARVNGQEMLADRGLSLRQHHAPGI